MADLDILIEDPRWEEARLPELSAQVAQACTKVLGLSDAFGFSLLGCDDARIADLNKEFRGKPVATNVLSWPSAERGAAHPGGQPEPADPTDPELGDVAIAFETCQREAEERGIPFEAHVTHLLLHGMLHLLGYDHETEADAELMEKLETRILANLGIPDPY